MKITHKLTHFAEWLVILFTTCIISYVSILVFLYHFNTENSIPMRSSFLIAALCLAVIFGILLLSAHISPSRRVNFFTSFVLLILALLFAGTVSFSYVQQTLLLPESDSKSCFDIALRFYQGDFSAVVPEGSYLSLWPFQTGFIFIIEKTMRLFKNITPLFFQQINCIYLLLLISSGYVIVCTLTKRLIGRALYLLLMATYFPLIFRVSEVYGDLPALSWMMFSCMCFVLFYKTLNQKTEWLFQYSLIQKSLKILSFLGFAGSAVIACIYKQNSLIYVIAFLLVTAVLQLRRFQAKIVIATAVTALLCIVSTGCIQKYYEYYAGNVCGKGVPTIAYLAMGLQYNGSEAIPGGWNGFHSNTYMETGYDYDETVRLSRESIQESVKGFSDNPLSAVSFFHTKVLKQWANQTHGIYWNIGSNYDITRNPNAFWVRWLEGGQYHKLAFWDDIHETILYSILLLACLKLLLSKIKKEKFDFQYLTPAVTFIGGFLFSLIWEGQTGAVIYYPVLALPTAIGFLF